LPAKSPARAPLQAHGIRLTRQRELLFEIINNAHRHLNADQLFDLLHYEGEQHYYETRLKRAHAHVVCLKCGAVQEFFGEPVKDLRDQIETSLGFKIEVARTEVGGLCADCQGEDAVDSPEEVEQAAS
jgi:Fur family ferric uptake transcriptional regulator